jgi:hypothetical protein
MSTRKPDLVFYYALNIPSTTINKTNLGSDIVQTATGIIYADEALKVQIGSFGFNITILNTTSSRKDNLYEGIGTNVYFLPQGTISNSINLKFLKLPNGNFVVPPKLLNVYQILSGSGDFLNSPGTIAQLTSIDDIFSRKMLVYFKK